MGRRALRTGDLVIPDTFGKLLTMFAMPDSVTDIGVEGSVGFFTFGLYLGGELTPKTTIGDRKWVNGKWVNKRDHRTLAAALVLDSKTMKYGWVQRKLLRRVDA